MRPTTTLAFPDAITLATSYNMQDYDQILESLFIAFSHDPNHLERYAQSFLDKPYLFEPLGEGVDAPFSQEPLYRTDKFDCVSYVNTLLSLINAKNLEEFKNNILAIRYSHPHPNYLYRTDWFTDLEWIPNAKRLGWINDITHTVLDKDQQPIAKIATTIIDKPNWLKVKPLRTMHLLAPLPQGERAQTLLQELRSYSSLFNAQTSQMVYLPIDKLFRDGKPNMDLFNQIPSPVFIAAARPDWPIRNEFPNFPQGYGTNLNVSHVGIGIRSQNDLLFYHASNLKGKVVCEPLIHYMNQLMENHPSFQGIHIEKIAGL